ncbi:MAG: major capsid protein [Schwartzia sp.]|nr:major capsid protein [Schwartzia sp. (in: firmicutes)]
MIEYNDTISLMAAMERMKPPASFLLDTFFPQVPATATTNMIMVEYRKGGRRLAPFIVKGSKGVNMKRDTSSSATYIPPMVGPRRTIAPEDLAHRTFGETVYSTMTEAQRAAQMQARDLVELQDMIVNRKNKMAADILTTGKCEIKGYADDGQTVTVDTVEFNEWTQKLTPSTHWDQPGATIYSDIKGMSETIQENAGQIPTLMLCGKNVEEYLIDNAEIAKWLAIPNRENLAMLSLAPRFVSPQIRRIGLLQSLNLEIYSYAETYIDDDNTLKPFLGDDDVIIAIPGRGRQLHGAVTLLNESGTSYNTYIGQYVPYYNGNKDTQEMSLTVYSRFLLAPTWADDWALIKTKG